MGSSVTEDTSRVTARSFPMIIDGQAHLTEAKSPVRNPATGDLVGYSPICDAATLDAAVAAANAAQIAWALTSDQERKDACAKISAIISEHASELAELLTREQGKPMKGLGSEFELGGASAWAGYNSTLEMPVKVLKDGVDGRIEQHRTPVGVVGSITPWNWPVLIAIWHIAPAIRAGNAVVIKPSPYTPLSTLRLVELINEVLPKGLVNSVAGDGDVGAMMSSHDGISKIVFTGSTATGKKIMKSSAGNLKRLTLELGGNDAGIILDDCDPATIAEGVFWGAFINSGQTCAALKRLYVPDNLYDSMCAELVKLAEGVPMKNGLDEGSALGPLQNQMQLDIVSSLVEDAKACGARILTGGAPLQGPGYFYPVTLVADIKPGARLVDEEQFGTALPIIRYTDIEEAIADANRLDVGLAASVWSPDKERARAVAERIEAGTVYINQHGVLDPSVPFGGIKGSGIGVEFGIEGLQANTDIKIYNFAAD